MLLKHSFIYFIFRISSGLISFSAIAIFTRLLTPEEYGLYSLVIAIISFFHIGFFQWLRLALLRFYPTYEKKNSSTLFSTLIFDFLLSAGFSAIVFSGLWFFKSDLLSANIQIWIIALLIVWVQSLFFLKQELIRSKLKPTFYGIISFSRAALYIILGVLLVKSHLGVWGLLIALFLSFLLPTIIVIKKDFRFLSRNHVNKKLNRDMFYYAFPLTASLLLNTIIHSSDRFFINYIIGIDGTGLYSSAYDLSQQILTLSMTIIGLAAYPLAVRIAESGNTQRMNHYFKKQIVFLFIIALPITLGLIIMAKDLSYIFLGEKFRESAHTLIPIIAIAVFFSGIRSYYFDLSFQLSKKTIHQIWEFLVAAIINLALNYVWIKKYGISGAAYSTFVSYFIAIILSYLIGRKLLPLPIPFRELFKIIIAVGISSVVVLSLNYPLSILAFFLKTMIAAIIYFIMLLLLNIMGIRIKVITYLKGYL